MAHGYERELTRMAESRADPLSAGVLRLVAGTTAFFAGEPRQAAKELARLAAEQSDSGSQALTLRTGMPVHLSGKVYSALASWQLGASQQAAERSGEAIALARAQDRPYELALALGFACWLHSLRRDYGRVRELVDECMSICKEHTFPTWLWMAEGVSGWTRAMQGDVEEGIDQINAGLSRQAAMQARLVRPYLLSLLSEAHEVNRDAPAAMAVIAQARARAGQTGELWWQAEIVRREGELRLAAGAARPEEAAAFFKQALTLAKQQGALTLALRAALSAARLARRQGRPGEAVELLAPTYRRFDKDEDSSDLLEASALLEALS